MNKAAPSSTPSPNQRELSQKSPNQSKSSSRPNNQSPKNNRQPTSHANQNDFFLLTKQLIVKYYWINPGNIIHATCAETSSSEDLATQTTIAVPERPRSQVFAIPTNQEGLERYQTRSLARQLRIQEGWSLAQLGYRPARGNRST